MTRRALGSPAGVPDGAPNDLVSRVATVRHRAVHHLLLVLIGLIVVVLVQMALPFRDGARFRFGFLLNLAALPVLGYALLANLRGQQRVALAIVTAILLIAGAVPVLQRGLAANPLCLLFFTLPIVLSGVVGARRNLGVCAAVAVASIFVSTALEEAGALPASPTNGDPDWWFSVQAASLLVLVAYFLDRFGHVLHTTLQDALAAQAEVRQQASERIRAQDALIEEQRFSTAALENLPAIFTLLGRDGRFTRWNRNFPRALGMTDKELANATLEDVFSPKDHEEVRRHVQRVFEDGRDTTEAALLTRAGLEVPHLLVASRLELEGNEYLAGVALNTSELALARTRIQSLSQELEERLERITALHKIDQAITGSLDIRLTLDVVLEQVIGRLQVDAASVRLLSRAEHVLMFGASRGLPSRELRGVRVRLGEGTVGRAALARRRVVLRGEAEIAAALPKLPFLRDAGFQAYVVTPLVAKGQLQGVLELFHRSHLEDDDDWHEYLTTLATQAAIAVDSATLFENLERSNLELRLAYDRTIEGWARALDLRDEETEGHSRRVTDMTVALAERLGFSAENLVHVRRGALLHDIGKMGIPDSILLKPGKLTDEEWAIMRRHPDYAVELLSPIEFLAPALPIPRSHHEKWDGSGYPLGLRGEEIPLPARIFAVVDVFDALTSERPYRQALSQQAALEYIESQSGKHFDPNVVAEFVAMLASPVDEPAP